MDADRLEKDLGRIADNWAKRLSIPGYPLLPMNPEYEIDTLTELTKDIAADPEAARKALAELTNERILPAVGDAAQRFANDPAGGTKDAAAGVVNFSGQAIRDFLLPSLNEALDEQFGDDTPPNDGENPAEAESDPTDAPGQSEPTNPQKESKPEKVSTPVMGEPSPEGGPESVKEPAGGAESSGGVVKDSKSEKAN